MPAASLIEEHLSNDSNAWKISTIKLECIRSWTSSSPVMSIEQDESTSFRKWSQTCLSWKLLTPVPAKVPDAMSHRFPVQQVHMLLQSCFPFFYYIVQQRMKTSTYLLLLLFLYYIWFPCRSKESLEKRNETYKKLRWMIHMPSYEDKTYPRVTWWLKEVAKYLINNNYIIFVKITNFSTC